MKRLIILFSVICSVVSAQTPEVQNGFVKLTYPNGKVSSEGRMVNGKPDGYWKTYYVSGVKKSEGNRRNFLLDSTWIFYDEKGDTTEKINYLMGKRNGYYYKYEATEIVNRGKVNYLKSKELFVNDRKEGLAYYYYPNGVINEVINYKNGKRSGVGKEFNEEGKIITLFNFYNDYMVDKQTINRADKKGLKQGLWQEFYDNGKVKSEKYFVNDTLNGYVKEYNENGTLSSSLLYQEGSLKQPENREEFPVEERSEFYSDGKVKNKGYYKKDVPVGIHVFYNENGEITNAKIFDDNGRVMSEGLLTEDGKKEGNWKNFYEDGEVKSQGVYKNNRQTGEWKFFYKQGVSEQIGNFNNGYFDGEWKWFNKAGKLVKVEEYVKGKRDGFYYELNSTGDTIARGSFLEGEREGDWMVKSGDVVAKGKYVNGLKEGIWREFYQNGNILSEGNYIQGNLDGKFLIYYENGKVKEEQNYVNGIKERLWKKFDEMGVVYLTIAYENNVEKRINGFKIEEIKKN